MPPRTYAAIALLSLGANAWADEGAVSPPPPVPSPQTPQPPPPQPESTKVTVQAVPTQPVTASPPQTITLQLVSQPVSQPPPQTITLQVVATQAPVQPVQYQAVASPVTVTQVQSAPATTTATVVAPGPIGRMVGHVGECLSRAGMSRLYVPTQQVQQVVYQPAQTVIAAPVQQVQYQPAAALASPQSQLAAPRKGFFGR